MRVECKQPYLLNSCYPATFTERRMEFVAVRVGLKWEKGGFLRRLGCPAQSRATPRRSHGDAPLIRARARVSPARVK